MAGDTWVAVDGRVGTSDFPTCWISDTGAYTGPDPAVPLHSGRFAPADSGGVQLLICAPNPDGDDSHVLDGSYSATDYDQTYYHAGAVFEYGNPAALDAGAHLFVVWYQPGLPWSSDPALLVAPSASPLDLAPATWVSGGRLVPSTATFELGALSLAASVGASVSSAVFRLGYDDGEA